MADRSPTDLKDFLDTARKRFKRGMETDDPNRKRALEALKFRNLEQWDEKIKEARETDSEGARPCLVVDKLNQHIQQVTNDERQNRPAIKVRPVDDKGDPEVAKVYQGIVRHIEDASSADIAYDTAYEQAVDGGYGYWRIVADYCDELSFDQDLRIQRIRNRFSVVLDPDHEQPSKEWGFVVEKVPRDEFKAKFPGKDPMAWDAEGKTFEDWCFEDHVMVAEYFYTVRRTATLCMYANGAIGVKEDGELPDGVVAGELPVKERKTAIKSFKWAKIDGKQVLEETAWAGKYLPIVEVVGGELDIEGKRHLSGLIRPAMDAQRMFNYAASTFVETVSLAPRAPWVAEEEQIQGHESDWTTANRRNIAVLRYKRVVEGGVLVPPPQRQNPAGIASGWQQAMQNSEHDIESAMGRYAATLGAPSNEKSGKAILARQREGDVGSFHFVDNLSRAIRYTGMVLVDLIPKYYDTQRVARILGEDGTPDKARLDPEQAEAVLEQEAEGGGVEKIYNLNVGKYDVTVTTGPAYTTKRMEAAEAMVQMYQADPNTGKLFADLMFKNFDWPGAEEIAERLKKTLPPGLAEAEDGESKEMASARAFVEQAQAQLQAEGQALMQAREEIAKAEEAAKAEFQKVDAAKADVEAELERVNAAKREMKLLEDLAGERLTNQELKASADIAEQQARLQKEADAIKAELEVLAVKKAECEQAAVRNVELERETTETVDRLEQMHAELLQQMGAIQAVVASPKRIVRDKDGRPVGVEIVQ